jgi:hypothetical protein
MATSQKPTSVDINQMERALRNEAASNMGGSSLCGAVPMRRAPIKGETPQQTKARMAREDELLGDQMHDSRRMFTGQIMPIRYDD